jgi:N6-adenosine-specific RNA methylase IME4
MADALVLVRHWGFRQKTILTWVKDRMGVGEWLRGQTEHCILAVRGRPVKTLTNQLNFRRLFWTFGHVFAPEREVEKREATPTLSVGVADSKENLPCGP